MIDDNGKKVSAIFKDKKNADKFNRNNPSDIKKLLQLAKKTKFPKAIDESVNEAYIVLYSPKKGVKPVTTAAYKDKKDAEKWAKDLGGITMIVKKKVKGIDESASKLAMGIAGFTGTRGVAVDDFINTHNIDAKKLFNFVKKGNLKDRMAFVGAIAGRPNNKMFKMITKQFGESVNESKSEVEQIAKKTKSETAFYDVLSKIEKKYGKRNYRIWLEKSLKDLGVNPKHYDYRTNAAAEEKLYQLTKWN